MALTDLDLLDGKSEPESLLGNLFYVHLFLNAYTNFSILFFTQNKLFLLDGKNLALRINFSLTTSSYATVVLRELMKTTENIEDKE